ncbi:MAG TPA: cobalamin-binding protein [Thermoplasmata archaeon]|nr:cobalamin-binding protein [Thermoplasmata archaeon]
MRIISLLPSATETVAALGHGPELVARSAECDTPRGVRSLPVTMRAKTLDSDRPSAEIDARVRETRGAGESLYELDVPLLARLRPDLILTQDLCGVCSVTEAEVSAACRAAGVTPKIVSLTPRLLADVANDIETIGAAVGASEPAAALARTLRYPASPSGATDPARVAVVEWLDPPILAGLWVPDMIACAGGRALGPDPGAPGEQVTWNAVARERPDLVVISPCSFSVERTVRELSNSRLGDRFLEIGARRGVWVADEAYFSRPGPRLAEGIQLLRALLGSDGSDRPMAIQRWDPPGAAVRGVG